VLSSTIVPYPEVSQVAAPIDVSGHETSSISVPAAELNHVAVTIASLADTMKVQQGYIAWLKQRVGAAATNDPGLSDQMVQSGGDRMTPDTPVSV
jgi:hypothetical protein